MGRRKVCRVMAVVIVRTAGSKGSGRGPAWRLVLDWSICSDIGREEQEDVKGLLGTKQTDLSYWSCAESASV